MGVVSLRHVLRPFLLSLLLAAGSAQASTICVGGYVCNEPTPAAEWVLPPVGGMEVIWPEPLQVIEAGNSRNEQRRERRHAEHRWTHDDAARFVHDWARRHHGDDFEEFRRHWHRGHHDHRGHHGHHDGDGDGCSDDNLPKPVPLPGTALLFAPALLMLRGFQRRDA